MLNTWLILLTAIAAETFATTMVKASDGFTRLLPSLAVIAGYAVSFYGLSHVVRVMNLGVAYAIWAGLGICFVSLMARYVFGQRLDLPALVGMALIVTGVLIIQFFSRTVSH
ncbi:MAG: SMR family transporter [Pantoea sp.]|uniref:DMT family transporter n=1 Tax=Pantoea sp. TaxID=69393 RepID=UPI0039E56545